MAITSLQEYYGIQIVMSLSAAQLKAMDTAAPVAVSLPDGTILPNAGAGFYWDGDLKVFFEGGTVALTSGTTLFLRNTGAAAAQRQAINSITGTTAKNTGGSALSTGIVENTGLELYVNATSLNGDVTAKVVVIAKKVAMS